MIICKLPSIPQGLNLEAKIATNIADVLKQYTNSGVLTVLQVNYTALEIHRLCVTEGYPVILKPIFLKQKTEKMSIKAPFITPGAHGALFTHGVELLPLRYPLSHLQHLCHCKCIEVFDITSNCLTVKDLNDSHEYKVEVEGQVSLQGVEAKTFASSRNIPQGMVRIYESNGEPVKVLGITDKKVEKLIVADIDIHNIGEEYQFLYGYGGRKSYNTANKSERTQLTRAITSELSQRNIKLNSKLLQTIMDVPETMGTLTVSEYVISFLINYACQKFMSPDLLIQHGPTSRYPLSQAPAEGFPRVDFNIMYGAIFPDGTVVGLFGEEVLAFYKIMIKKGYSFRMHETWVKQLDAIDATSILDLECDLVENGLIKSRESEHLLSSYSRMFLAHESKEVATNLAKNKADAARNKKVNGESHLTLGDLVPKSKF